MKTASTIPAERNRFDIFISYSSIDEIPAQKLFLYLQKKGFSCWKANNNISPGDDYPAAIVNGINHSTVMLIVFSQHSNQSASVAREVEMAFNRKLILLPVRMADIPYSEKLEYFLSSVQRTDAFPGIFESHFDTIYRICKQLLKDITEKREEECIFGNAITEPTKKKLWLFNFIRHRDVRYKWLFLIGVALAALVYLFMSRAKTFNLSVYIQNTTPNSNLPVNKGVLLLHLGNETRTDTLTPGEESVFPQVPIKYKKAPFQLKYISDDFHVKDTTVSYTGQPIQLPVARNEKYGLIKLQIADSLSKLPVEGVMGKIKNIICYSDSTGIMEFHIPYQEQQKTHTLYLFKDAIALPKKQLVLPIKAGKIILITCNRNKTTK